MKDFKFLLDPMRVPFLILTPACVVLGLAAAVWTSGQVNWFHFVLVLIGALSAHVSVNIFNEYFDFKSGLDADTIRTPFSGGSGRLPESPEIARPALIMAWIFFGITALIGLFFVYKIGSGLIPLGLLGLLIIYFYTEWITRFPLMCLIAPGLGFGTLMVMGTDFVLTGQYSWTAFLASLVPFFLVNNLLLLNQFPDVEADQNVGRKHLPIKIGKEKSSWIYIVFLLLPYAVIVFGVITEYFPLSSLIGFLSLPLAILNSRGVLHHADNTEELIPFLGQNVIINLVTPVLVAIGIFIGWPG
ncbi:MAG: prenyltransferase [Anaerolineales bacterium]|nr:prenyltransferase [Anaerolineales bacterium]